MNSKPSLSTRSSHCRCTKGCPANLPIVFLSRSHKYTMRDPCICPPNNLTCANQNKNICNICHRAHRLDALRRPEYSTFSCQWCLVLVLNTEKEIRSHLQECTHRPYPTVHMENEMCYCKGCERGCSFTTPFNNNFVQRYQETHREFVYQIDPHSEANQQWFEGMSPVEIFKLARETVNIPNIISSLRGEYEQWNICRIGLPPFTHPNVHHVPYWLFTTVPKDQPK